MCGIVVDVDGPEDAIGARMLARLGHRGPDDLGERRVGRTWLGHARLSIVDVQGGGQPLVDRDGRRFVICNGEIYNHRILRDRLGPERFLTDSDTEAALHVVAAWGPSAVAELNGMFAVCVADADGEVVMARDPLGIKPLYWAQRGERTLFASELRAFERDWRPRVRTFPPGHVWTPETGLRPFASITEEADLFTTRAEALEAVRAALITSVRERLMADVPVGVFLSGGLDSSLVAAIAERQAAGDGERLHSFAVGLAGSPDLVAARMVSDHLGLEHHERVYDAAEAAAVLEEAVIATESYEPSLVRSAVPNYLLAELAAQHVKVVLTGEGADELFAGYDHYRDIADAEALNAELVRNVAGLHDLNLQRCDRVTMAHGLEARVPFLDRDVIAVAQRVPPPWKLPGPTGQEKRLLREAFEGWLPHEVLWRRKEQFGDGSGASKVLPEHAAGLVGPDWESQRVEGLPAPRSREELAYQRIFARHLAGINADRVLGRFATV